MKPWDRIYRDIHWDLYWRHCFGFTGYFIHDIFDVLLHDLRNSPGLLFHHVLVSQATINCWTTKTLHLVLQHCCKKIWMAMLSVLPTNQTSLATNQVFASCVNNDIWLDKITRESRHTRELYSSLLQNKFSLGRQNAPHVQMLLQKVELLPTLCNKFSQPVATWFVAETGLNVACVAGVWKAREREFWEREF